MTARLQAGPFKFVSQSEPLAQAPCKSLQWPKQELIKYAAFLNFSKGDITSQEEALSWSFLRKMSIFIQSKNPNQCRIFHKKMMEQHSCLDLLIAALRNKIEKFQEWLEHYEPALKNVKHCLQRETATVEKQPTSIKIQPQRIQAAAVETASQLAEKGKEDLRPTDIDYPEENVQIQKRQINYNLARPVRPAFGFQSFGDSDYQKESNINDFNYFNKRERPSFSFERRNESVLDVHSSFMTFLGKLGGMGAFQQ